jgi:hypothetical protein
VIGEAVGGGAIGGAGALVGGLVVGVAELGLDRFDTANLGLAFGRGAMLGYVVGVPIAVYLIGQSDTQACSGIGALAGSVVGALPGVVAAHATFTDDAPLPAWKFALLIGGPVVGAVLGCNLHRRYVPAPIVTRDTAGVAMSFRF